MACSKEKMILLEPVMAARKRKDLQHFSLKATNILQSWHAYLDGVEGNSKASHSKTVHFVDSYRPCFAESLMSPSEAETTLMMSEGDATAPLEINEEESGQEPQESTSKEKPLEMTKLPTSELPVTPVVSCSSPYKFDLFEDPGDVMGEAKKTGTSSKPPSVSSNHRMELETKLVEEQIAAKMMRKKEEMELRQLQREMELLAKR